MSNPSQKLLGISIALLTSLSLLSCAEKGIESVLKIPKDFSPVYKIQQTEDLSRWNVKRLRAKITVPTGLTKEQLTANIKHAIISLYKKHSPKAISVLVYKHGDSLDYGFTVAMSEFAPYGEWGRAKENLPIEKYECKINFYEGYFIPVVEIKFGLNLSQRKNIYKGIVAAQDRANKEAEGLYPKDASKIPMNKL